MKTPRLLSGFTLIELMLVVAIIGLLAAIALPKFANLVRKSKEAAIKGQLGAFRSAVSIYYCDNESLYPNFDFFTSPTGGLVPKYIAEIPRIQLPSYPDHLPGDVVTISPVPLTVDWASIPPYSPWNFDVASGRLFVACLHTDVRSSTWSLF